VLDASGAVLAEAQAPSTNWNSVGIPTAQANLALVIERALANAGRESREVAAVCVAAAGVDRPSDYTMMEAWLGAILPDALHLVHNDAVAALASGTGGEVFGVVLISGTGMIAYGFERDGRSQRAGGWGPLLGDPGSGYILGRDALAAVAWAADGRGPSTRLTQAILAHLGMETPESLIGWAYEDYRWDRFAGLAPVVLACAEEGDAVTQEILERGASGLTQAVAVVIQGLGLADRAFPLVLAGGTLRPGPYADRIKAKLAAIAPHAQIIHPQLPPVHGAGLLAWKAKEER
jgi:N-acetylglucosamine kinase-like BadF-type ATPase